MYGCVGGWGRGLRVVGIELGCDNSRLYRAYE